MKYVFEVPTIECCLECPFYQVSDYCEDVCELIHQIIEVDSCNAVYSKCPLVKLEDETHPF